MMRTSGGRFWRSGETGACSSGWTAASVGGAGGACLLGRTAGSFVPSFFHPRSVFVGVDSSICVVTHCFLLRAAFLEIRRRDMSVFVTKRIFSTFFLEEHA